MGSDRRSPPPPRRRHIDTAPGVSVGIPPSKPLCPTPSLPPAVFLPWPRPPHDAATEPPCTDPYARWWGRGGAVRLPPIPIEEIEIAGSRPAMTIFASGGLVRSRRLELPRSFPHSDLNAARLPIPPRPHGRGGVISKSAPPYQATWPPR